MKGIGCGSYQRLSLDGNLVAARLREIVVSLNSGLESNKEEEEEKVRSTEGSASTETSLPRVCGSAPRRPYEGLTVFTCFDKKRVSIQNFLATRFTAQHDLNKQQ